jgi:outer membrane protein TolC
MAQNPSAVVAEQEITRAQALVRQVRSQALPTLIGRGTYTRIDGDRALAGRIISPADSFNANLTLTVPLLAPPQWAQWAVAKERVDIARLSAVDVRRQLGIAAGRAYLAILSQKRVVEANRRARDAAKAHYDFAHSRFSGGVGNRLDEVRAAQELATDDAQVHAAEAGLARAREALGVVVGAEVPVDTLDEPPFMETPPPIDDVMTDATTRRSDVRAAESRRANAQHAARLGWTDYLPLLSGSFQPYYQDPATLTQPTFGWQAQLILTLPLYDGGLRYGQQRERVALSAEADAAVVAALRQARSDVRAAFDSLREADQSLAAAREAARLQHEALDLANLAYRAGATTNLEVIDAERRARDADTAVAMAEDSARQARLDLLAAGGRFP